MLIVAVFQVGVKSVADPMRVQRFQPSENPREELLEPERGKVRWEKSIERCSGPSIRRIDADA